MSATLKYLTLLLLAVFFSCMSFGQNECSDDLDKKTQKLIDSATDRKNDMKKRFDLMREAVEYDESCLKCRMLLGELYFKRAERNPSLSYSTALNQFLEIESQCPEYHSDVPYFMGVIYYGQEEWSKSEIAFEKFLEFSDQDQSRLSRDYEQKYGDVQSIIEEVRSNAELFENPIDFNPNRVKGVSSNFDEYLPMLSPDNELMFYTRKREKSGKSVLDKGEIEEFTLSRRNSIESSFDAGTALPAPFNVGDNYGGATLSVDNKTMYVTVCKPVSSTYNDCDLYSTRYSKQTNQATGKEEFVWSELVSLGANVNSDGWEAQPSLSADGNTLYFATARESSNENSIDIYYAKRDEQGNWGKAKSLSAAINTSGNEKSPFMHGDSRTLYFSANSASSVGGYDIFFSKLEDEGRWTKPQNIGVPINTKEDEHGLIVATDGAKAYYASRKISGAQGFDIFAFELPERAKPEKVLLVKGTVKDDNGQVVQDARIELNYVESKRVDKIEINSDDGSYATIVNVEREPVVMTIESEEHAFKATLLNEEKANQGLVSKIDFELNEVEVGKPYAIDDINYPTNSASMNEDSKAVLQMFAAYLHKNPQLRIAIHGHTDNVGKKEDNNILSTERAFEVMKFLQEQGVSADLMTFKGIGPSEPIADNATAQGRAKNRRTEFVVTGQ